MERMPHSERSHFASDCVSSWRAINNGVVVKTARDRHKYWGHWVRYASLCKVDPFLDNIPSGEKDIILAAFAARVRTGTYGRATQIKVSGVQDALASITKTIQLAGKPSPLYRSDGIYTLVLERMIEGYRREDPKAVPQLAVPITLPNMCYKAAMISPSPAIKASGQLCLIAFYYLLRVGEYTQPRFVLRNGTKHRSTRTKQFSTGNVEFFKNNLVLSRTAPLEVLLTADAATLKISNQKNGRMGDTIHQRAITSDCCPVKALAHRAHHILSNGGNSETLLCSYMQDDVFHTVNSQSIIKILRASASILKLEKQNIDPDLIGAHSLRAGGAMALRLHGYDDTTIQKMGRWTSNTFLQYIHTQIAHLSKDISEKMSIPLPFLNIAAIET